MIRKTITSPMQTQHNQNQTVNNNILDEYVFIETVRDMPLWLNTEPVSISENSSINDMCSRLVNNVLSDTMSDETFLQFENIIRQKRLITLNKAEYDRQMENNIF